MAPIDNQLDIPSSPLLRETNLSNIHETGRNASNLQIIDKSSQFSFDKTELTRLLLQNLKDLNYNSAADALIKESGINLNSDIIEEFLTLIQKGKFNDSIVILGDLKDMLIDHNVSLSLYLTFIIRREFFLECLILHSEKIENKTSTNPRSEDLDFNRLDDQFILNYLRNDLNDLLQKIAKFPDSSQNILVDKDHEIHQLTSLIMNINSEECLKKLNFDPADFDSSRKKLCDFIITFIKPEFKLPNERLLDLLNQSIKYQQSTSVYHLHTPPGSTSQYKSNEVSLLKDFTPDKSRFPVELLHRLDHHDGEVWYGTFSNNGKYLASTSLDSKIIIYSVLEKFEVKRKFTCGSKAVMLCSWSPNDKYLLSCCADTFIRIWDVEHDKLIHKFKLESSTRCWSCDWLPNNKEFIVGSPDKYLKLYNIEGEELFDFFKSESLLNSSATLNNNSLNPSTNPSSTSSSNPHPNSNLNLSPTSPNVNGNLASTTSSERVQDITVTKDGSKLITINLDKKIHVWDIPSRKRINVISIGRRLTSIVSSSDSNFVLVNVSPEEVQLWDLRKSCLVKKYIGQQQLQYIIRGCFGNWDESLILSGSEDGKIYIWDRESCALIFAVDGHNGLANCVDWNRNGYMVGDVKYGLMWCSVGDDKIVNIWGVRDV